MRVGQGQGQGQGPDGLTPLPHLPRGHERKGRLGEREAAGRGFRVRERPRGSVTTLTCPTVMSAKIVTHMRRYAPRVVARGVRKAS